MPFNGSIARWAQAQYDGQDAPPPQPQTPTQAQPQSQTPQISIDQFKPFFQDFKGETLSPFSAPPTNTPAADMPKPPERIDTPITDAMRQYNLGGNNNLLGIGGATLNEMGKALQGFGNPTRGDEVAAAPVGQALGNLPGMGLGIASLYALNNPDVNKALQTPLRDVPVLGGAVRGAEAGLAALNAGANVTGPLASGSMAIARQRIPDPVKDFIRKSAGVPTNPFAGLLTGVMGNDTPDALAKAGTTPQEAEGLLGGFLNGTLDDAGMQRFETIARGLGKNEEQVNPVSNLALTAVFDPLTWMDGAGVFSKLGEISALRRAWAAGADVTKVGGMVDKEPLLNRMILKVIKPTSAAVGELLPESKVGLKARGIIDELNPFGLSKQSAVADALNRAKDAILPFMGSDAIPAVDKFKFAETLAEAKKTGNIGEQLQQFFGRGAANSVDMQTGIHGLLDFKPAKSRVQFEQANAILQDVATAQKRAIPLQTTATNTAEAVGKLPKQYKPLFEAYNAGEMDITELSRAVDRMAGMDLADEMLNHMNKVFSKGQKIAPPNAAQRLLDQFKAYQGLLYVRGSPAMVVNNIINNTATTMRHGVDIARNAEELGNFFNRIGYHPPENFGKMVADEIRKASSIERGAMGANVPKWANNLPGVKQLGHWYSAKEAEARAQAFASGFERYMAHNFKLGTAFTPTPEWQNFIRGTEGEDNLRRRMSQLEAARNKKEAQAALFGNTKTFEAYKTYVAQEWGKKFSQLAGRPVTIPEDFVTYALPFEHRTRAQNALNEIQMRVARGEDANAVTQDVLGKINQETRARRNYTARRQPPTAQPQPQAAPQPQPRAPQSEENNLFDMLDARPTVPEADAAYMAAEQTDPFRYVHEPELRKILGLDNATESANVADTAAPEVSNTVNAAEQTAQAARGMVDSVQTVPDNEAALYNVYAGALQQGNKADYLQFKRYSIVEDGKATPDQIADYLENKGVTVLNRPAKAATEAGTIPMPEGFQGKFGDMWDSMSDAQRKYAIRTNQSLLEPATYGVNEPRPQVADTYQAAGDVPTLMNDVASVPPVTPPHTLKEALALAVQKNFANVRSDQSIGDGFLYTLNQINPNEPFTWENLKQRADEAYKLIDANEIIGNEFVNPVPRKNRVPEWVRQQIDGGDVPPTEKGVPTPDVPTPPNLENSSPNPLDEIQNSGITRGMSKYDAKQAQYDNNANAIISTFEKKYGDAPVTLTKTGGNGQWSAAMIAPSPRKGGLWQVTTFDKNGLIGDETFSSKLDAVREYYMTGYRTPKDPAWTDKVFLSEPFKKGNADVEAARNAFLKESNAPTSAGAKRPLSIKETYKNAKQAANFTQGNEKHVVFLQIGDFYQTFENDAKKVASITGTIEHKGITGFPVNASDKYIKQLQDAGEQVFIVKYGNEAEKVINSSELQPSTAPTPAVPPAPIAPDVAPKEAWQMTRDEWSKAHSAANKAESNALKSFSSSPKQKEYAWGTSERIRLEYGVEAKPIRKNGVPIVEHRAVIEKALSEGKPVPAEVLADYPDLAKSAPAQAESAAKPLTEIEQKVQAEYAKGKFGKSGGFTPTQEEYIVDKLNAFLENPKKKGVTIEVPGDGKITAKTEDQARNIKTALTKRNNWGNTTVKRDFTMGKQVQRAIDMYGSPERAAQSISKQLEQMDAPFISGNLPEKFKLTPEQDAKSVDYGAALQLQGLLRQLAENPDEVLYPKIIQYLKDPKGSSEITDISAKLGFLTSDWGTDATTNPVIRLLDFMEQKGIGNTATYRSPHGGGSRTVFTLDNSDKARKAMVDNIPMPKAESPAPVAPSASDSARIAESAQQASGASAATNSPLADMASQYGWTVKETPQGIILSNRKGNEAAIITQKGKKYTVTDMGGNKLLTGNNKVETGAERVIKEYFYGEKIASPRIADRIPPNQQFNEQALYAEIEKQIRKIDEIANDAKNRGAEAVLDENLNQEWNDALTNDLIEMLAPLVSQDAGRAANVMPPDLVKQTNQWLDSTFMPALTQAKQQANGAARFMQEATVLNYDKRWNVDEWLSTVAPFSFWWLHTLGNYTRDFIDHPALLAYYVRLKKMMDEQSNGMPERFKGRIPMPLASQLGMGDALWIDPLRSMFPAEDVFQISQMERANYNTVKEDGSVDASSVFSDLFGIHTPYKLAWALLAGKPDEMQNIIGSIPAARLLRGITAPIVPGGIGLPSKYDDAYYKRAVKELVADGKLTADQAKVALLQQSGPYWDMVKSRAGIENYTMRELSGLTGFRGQVFTPGEQKYYEAMRGKTALIDQLVQQLGGSPSMTPEQKTQFLRNKGAYNEGALRDYLDANPELEAGAFANMPDQETRYREYLKDKIWEKWNTLDKQQKKQVSGYLGRGFTDLFLDKPDSGTRNYDQIPVSAMEAWARFMDIGLPQVVGLNPLAQAGAGMTSAPTGTTALENQKLTGYAGGKRGKVTTPKAKTSTQKASNPANGIPGITLNFNNRTRNTRIYGGKIPRIYIDYATIESVYRNYPKRSYTPNRIAQQGGQ